MQNQKKKNDPLSHSRRRLTTLRASRARPTRHPQRAFPHRVRPLALLAFPPAPTHPTTMPPKTPVSARGQTSIASFFGGAKPKDGGDGGSTKREVRGLCGCGGGERRGGGARDGCSHQSDFRPTSALSAPPPHLPHAAARRSRPACVV